MDIFSIPLLTISISLFICWAMFAIFCSTIHEAISLLKAERGRFMKKWILKQLLDHPNGLNWGSMLYAHGSIDLLTRATSTPTNTIESKLFAETLIEVVGNANVVKLEKSKVNLTYKSEVLNNFKAATLILKPSDVVSFYQKAMHSAELCKDLNGNADESAIYNCLVLQVQRWYDEMSERISFWYKKRTRARLFYLGILLAMIFNIDSVQLFNFLGKNKSSQIVLMNFYEANADRLNKLALQTNDSLRIDSLGKKLETYTVLIDSVAKAASLPIGWEYSILNKSKHSIQSKDENTIVVKAEKSQSFWQNIATFFKNCWDFLFKVLLPKGLGFTISGLAASFGAPFWFDLLKKIYSNKPQKV